jgi:hypothetical protein
LIVRSACFHAVSNCFSTAVASTVFFWSCSARERPYRPQPFPGSFARSARKTACASAKRPAGRSAVPRLTRDLEAAKGEGQPTKR